MEKENAGALIPQAPRIGYKVCVGGENIHGNCMQTMEAGEGGGSAFH